MVLTDGLLFVERKGHVPMQRGITVSRSSERIAAHPIIPHHNANAEAQLFSYMWCKSSLMEDMVVVCVDFAEN